MDLPAERGASVPFDPLKFTQFDRTLVELDETALKPFVFTDVREDCVCIRIVDCLCRTSSLLVAYL